MPSEDQKDQQKQSSTLSPIQTSKSKTSTTNANSTIGNELANMTQAFKDKKKLVRRAFSMPRNLFRLSRRINKSATAKESTVAKESVTSSAIPTTNSCNQSVQTVNIDEQTTHSNAEHTDHNKKHHTLPVTSTTAKEMNSQQKQQQYLPEAKPHSESDNKHRLFRRSTWKKFLFSRFILQSINLKVNHNINFSISISISNFYSLRAPPILNLHSLFDIVLLQHLT